MDEKLQKVLARAGFGSRRELEEWIKQGRVKINGEVATIGDRVRKGDALLVDGKKVNPNSAVTEMQRVLLYNKPEDEICSRKDPEGRRSVFDKLPLSPMVVGSPSVVSISIQVDYCYSPLMVSSQIG